jgi:hypothetical protein
VKKKPLQNLFVSLPLVIATIISSRIFLYFTWDSRLMESQKQDSWHHFYTGVLLVLVAFCIPKKYRVYVTSIGVGLFVDELVHAASLLGLTKCFDYWSGESYVGILIGLSAVAALQFLFIVYKKK